MELYIKETFSKSSPHSSSFGSSFNCLPAFTINLFLLICSAISLKTSCIFTYALFSTLSSKQFCSNFSKME
ncbi:hypothetical protein F383_33850 [Gossypium arboreum]|uniref:Uncharacterized protein n=1 Tax=Gossypium arboreum TaxID=29729 RepID=A0A0B0MPQ2_GOSAR|nr:hypothetical protein F383_28926 [Gossypium arboreum]KHG05053.1 hypothetical protein F383_31681 [Gossypium arboreum]KHG18537.1 hypothetical protein F383_26396 [Gossypium arboreum]KHG27114.1 hypothetical protein F383_33850 [Gossypium arboreum]